MNYTHLTVPIQFVEIGGDKFAYRRWGNSNYRPTATVFLAALSGRHGPLEPTEYGWIGGLGAAIPPGIKSALGRAPPDEWETAVAGSSLLWSCSPSESCLPHPLRANAHAGAINKPRDQAKLFASSDSPRPRSHAPATD